MAVYPKVHMRLSGSLIPDLERLQKEARYDGLKTELIYNAVSIPGSLFMKDKLIIWKVSNF